MKHILFAFFILISVVSSAKVGFYGGLYEMSAFKALRPGFALSSGITARNNNMYFTIGRTGTGWSTSSVGEFMHLWKMGFGYSRTVNLGKKLSFLPGVEFCMNSGGYRNNSKNSSGGYTPNYNDNYTLSGYNFHPYFGFDYAIYKSFRISTSFHTQLGNATVSNPNTGLENEFKATPYFQVGITYR